MEQGHDSVNCTLTLWFWFDAAKYCSLELFSSSWNMLDFFLHRHAESSKEDWKKKSKILSKNSSQFGSVVDTSVYLFVIFHFGIILANAQMHN